MKKISERALIKRINRRLAKDGEQMHKYSGLRWHTDFGNYYVSNGNNHIVGAHTNPNDLAADLGINACC